MAGGAGTQGAVAERPAPPHPAPPAAPGALSSRWAGRTDGQTDRGGATRLSWQARGRAGRPDPCSASGRRPQSAASWRRRDSCRYLLVNPPPRALWRLLLATLQLSSPFAAPSSPPPPTSRWPRSRVPDPGNLPPQGTLHTARHSPSSGPQSPSTVAGALRIRLLHEL